MAVLTHATAKRSRRTWARSALVLACRCRSSPITAAMCWREFARGSGHIRIISTSSRTYDITHGLAILLKNQLEPDAGQIGQFCPGVPEHATSVAADRGELSEAPGLAQQSAVPQPGKSLEVGQKYVGLASGGRGGDFGGATWCWRSRGGYMVGRETGLAASVLRQNGDPAPRYISAQGSTRIYPYPSSILGSAGSTATRARRRVRRPAGDPVSG